MEGDERIRNRIAALAKTPCPLVKKKTQAGNGRWVNIFRLPEE